MTVTELLTTAGMGSVRKGQPLPIYPAGAVPVGPAAGLVETSDGGVVLVWAMATWCWAAGDVVGRRLAAVGLVATKTATQREVAAAFDVDDATLRRWTRAWQSGGATALAACRRGPKRPSKLTDEVVGAVRAARDGGATEAEIAARTELSRRSVQRALAARPAAPALEAPRVDPGAALVPLTRPEPRLAERSLARAGLLAGAEPVICQGAALPLAGALLILPALEVTGLLAVAEEVYRADQAAFYDLRALLLTIVFAALVGEPRAEGLTRTDPVALGRLLGLDRAPEVGTLRRRMEQLAATRRAEQLLMGLARHHAAAHPEAMGVLYVDGHVRAYHGGADLPRAHLARARIAMAATTDTWLADARGEAVLVWSSAPGAALTSELRTTIEAVRDILGPDARPTIAFDRGGWSPALFAELRAAGWHILTYRKGKCRREPRTAFTAHEVTDAFGHVHDYLLADRRVRIPYQSGRRYFACRQVTRLDPASGHQTQVVTTRDDLVTTEVATSMFARWREENLFRYLRPHYALDGMDAYAKTADDPTRLVPNPAKARAQRERDAAKAALAATNVTLGQASRDGGRVAVKAARADCEQAQRHLDTLQTSYADIPAKLPLGEIRPAAVRLDDERKRIHDATRMATYNAESTLARALGPHYARAEDEARSLLREAFRASADIEVVGSELHVRLDPLAAPRRSRAIAGLAAELTATQTIYPGTQLRLVYSVKGY
ncbi:MAG: helix-turn-helix domain-containing protein [Mycobacteriales bacterium]